MPRPSVQLYQALIDSRTEPKRVLAADLTTDPNVLTQRREYLAVNRRLIEAGGTVQRLFICWQDDLARQEFARALLSLIDHHRSLGVQCALAVRSDAEIEAEHRAKKRKAPGAVLGYRAARRQQGTLEPALTTGRRPRGRGQDAAAHPGLLARAGAVRSGRGLGGGDEGSSGSRR
ncbi:hypothetical protein [Streptomyces sp. B4I13]|uniref:hypothetical protein n=1 Tax=Streptomyces sp. B4I13 TaxID=3042271 RepID=UPI0027D7BAE8|nr:hypothetical protein [Streptomyces sp. B4I13]